MPKKVDKVRERQKEMVRDMLVAKGPRMMKMCLDFIENNFNEEDKDLRRDAHKLFGKWFDSQIPKTQIIESKNETKVINDPRFFDFIKDMTKTPAKAIEVEEAEIISQEDALSVRRIGK